MDSDAQKNVCRDFLSSRPKAVFATVDDEGKPHTSLMLYVIDENWNLYFGTKKSSKKYPHIIARPDMSVSVLEGTLDPLCAVDIAGPARELEGEEKGKYVQFFKEHNPSAFYVEDSPDFVLFRIEPHSIHMSDARSGELVQSDIL